MKNWTHLPSILQALILFASINALAPAEAALNRPNILFIMSDDHAAHAMSCYGSVVNKTPNMDRIAREGVRFERCFAVNSICTPSRATILTGKYSHINGVPVFNRFDGSQPTVAKYLQAAGYYTGIIGKWHLGSDPTGFDKWMVLPGQGLYFDPVFLTPEGRKVIPGYASDIITDLAIDFLKARPKDKPFLLMCQHKAPHRPWEPDAKHKAMFAGKEIPEPPTLRDDYATRTDAIRECKQKVFEDLTRRDLKLEPPADLKGTNRAKWLQTKPAEVEVEVGGQKKILTGEELNKWKYQRYMQDYLACIQSMDDNIGRLLDWLDVNGLRENTVVIYTSDQGFFLGDHGLYDKRFMYEPSIKMPFIIRWPGVIKPDSVEQSMAINCDFAPTFMELAGLPVPRDMQGVSLVPLFKGNHPANWRTSMYYRYYHDPGDHDTRAHYGVRTLTHKLIYYWKKDQWELFDLAKDPDELRNIYMDPAQQQLVAKLKTELYRLKKGLKDDDQFADKQPPPGVDGQPVEAGADYRIFSGSTHAHTSNTWSHGDHFINAKKENSESKEPGLIVSAEGVQTPPKTKTLKPEWRKHQGPPSEHFARARTNGYDFYSVTDHSQEATFHPLSPTNAAWLSSKRDAAQATDANFVAISGYEHSENNGPGGKGHLNVLNSAEYLNALAPGIDLKGFYEWLKSAKPNGDGPVVASFNHPGPKQYNDWADRDPQITEIITLLEVINSNKGIHYQGFVSALDHGWKVSPVCGNDNHGFYGIAHQTSRTFVLATNKTKAAILDAMKNRRTYASLDNNIQCRYTVNGAVMGSTLNAPNQFAFDISITDPDTNKPENKITKIEIIKDGGQAAQTFTPEPAFSVHWKPRIEDSTNKYFFVRVWNACGGDAPGADPAKPIAWLAPVWTGR